jgi:hypothetical protein
MCVCFIRLKYVGHVFLFSTRPFIFGRALGNPLMRCRTLFKTGNFLTRWKAIRFQILNLLYGFYFFVNCKDSGFGGLEVACWPLVPKFAGSHPAEAGEKILSTTSFGEEVKPSAPCRGFTACNKSLNVTWNSAFRQNYWTFLVHSSTFRRWVLSRGDTRGDAWWRKLERLNKIAQ